jgi:tetratricopeptide (TPR) repeat protein
MFWDWRPARTRALSILYEIRKAQGKTEASAALIRRIVALEPNDFWATNELTLLLLVRGNVVDAERHARNAVRIASENAQSHYLMGLVLTEANRPAVGEYHYNRALALSGARNPVVVANLALCLKNQGKMSAARATRSRSPPHPIACIPCWDLRDWRKPTATSPLRWPWCSAPQRTLPIIQMCGFCTRRCSDAAGGRCGTCGARYDGGE